MNGLKIAVICEETPKTTVPAKKKSYTVEILMVDIEYGIESDSEDKKEYCLEDENTIDNPMDNASSGNVVIFDPSPEQSVSTGVDVIVIE